MVELSDILGYSDEKRSRLRLKGGKGRNIRKPHERMVRPDRDADELLEYFKDNGITSKGSLLKIRLEGDPMPYDYVKAFGSWQNVKNMVHGEPTAVTISDPQYMIKCIIEFDLWKRTEYEEARRLRPDVLPSMYLVLKRWGRWSNLTVCARDSSFKKVLDSYVALHKKIRRIPSMRDCKKENIKLKSVIEFFGTKGQLDKILPTMESNDEKS